MHGTRCRERAPYLGLHGISWDYMGVNGNCNKSEQKESAKPRFFACTPRQINDRFTMVKVWLRPSAVIVAVLCSLYVPAAAAPSVRAEMYPMRQEFDQ